MANIKLSDKLTWEELATKVLYECNDNRPKFYNWFSSKSNDGGFFFNSLMYNRAFNIYDTIVNDDRDHFITICGKEGTGKSTLSIQLACAIDPTFCIERICFKPLDFIRGIKKSKPGQCFILDEGNLFLFGRQAMGFDNVLMVKLFALMRQRNLCVIINVPNFFTLDPYVRNHRVDTLIYCFQKGKFQCFVDSAIRIISHEGYQYKRIAGIKTPDGKRFAGYWNNELPKINDITVENYKSHKHDQFSIFLDDMEKMIVQRNEKELLTPLEIKEKANISKHNLIKEVQKGNIRGKMIGNKWYFSREDIFEFKKEEEKQQQPTDELKNEKQN